MAGLKGDGYGADRKAWVLGRKACGAGRPSAFVIELQRRGTLRKPKIGISWRYTGEGLICLRPSHHLKAETEEERVKNKDKRDKKKRRKTIFSFPPIFLRVQPC